MSGCWQIGNNQVSENNLHTVYTLVKRVLVFEPLNISLTDSVTD